MAWMGKFAGLIGVSVLLLTGCEVVRNARSDLDRLPSASFSSPRAARPAIAPGRKPGPATAVAPAPRPTSPAAQPAVPPDRSEIVAPRISLVGQSEGDIRARFGEPASVEDRAPGKTLRYRHGPCTLDVSLYPDVQTRQFKTLAYEVRSDDDTDRGKQSCLGQLQSRAGSR